MASIRQRKSGLWQAIVRKKGYPDQSRTFIHRADAATWARSVEVEMDRGAFVSRREAESTTLRDALARYLREITPRKKGAAQEKYRIRALRSDPLARRSLV